MRNQGPSSAGMLRHAAPFRCRQRPALLDQRRQRRPPRVREHPHADLLRLDHRGLPGRRWARQVGGTQGLAQCSMAAKRCRSVGLWILPTALRGSASAKATERGTL